LFLFGLDPIFFEERAMALPSIVVADEDHEFLLEIVPLLSAEFDVVATATDGKEALNLIRSLHPDAAVLGYHLPMLSGIDITRHLAQERPSVPIVICSAETHSLIVQAARRAGALGYVFKRFAHRDLIAAVKMALRGQSFRSYSSPLPFDEPPPEAG
jgi:two-component system nitrate/nitrite response regulator NarL